jgi:hypothetical protein
MRRVPLALLVVAAGAAGWLLLQGLRREQAIEAAPAAGLQPTPAAPQAEAAAVSNDSVAASASAARATTDAPRHWDLCGLGRLPIPPGAAASGGTFDHLPELPAHLARQAQEQALQRALETLRQGNARQQAVASLWSTGEAHAPGLAAVAASTGDPMALTFALQRCHDQPQAGACALLPPQALARAEPENLTGWLLWAARRPQDEALWAAGALATTRYSQHWSQVPQTLLAALPADVPGYLGVFLAVEGTGVQAALPDITLLTAVRLCRPPQPATRAPLCRHLAQVMADASDTMTGQGIGIRLGEWAGWSDERRVAARRAMQEATDAVSRHGLTMLTRPQPLDCASVQEWRTWVDTTAALGEPRAAQALARAASASRR